MRALGALASAAAGLGGVSVAACLVALPATDPFDGGSDGEADAGSGDASRAPARCGDGIIQRAAGEVCDPGPDAGAPSASGCSANCTSVLCPAGGFQSPLNDHCYFALDAGNVSMGKAASGCAAQGAHLVTFDDDAEESFIDQSFQDAGGAYWMALSIDALESDPVYDVGSVNEPGWRASCTGCYGPLLLPKLETSFPNVCKGTAAGPCVAHNPSSPFFFGAPCSGSCDADAGTSAVGDGSADAAAAVHAVCEREPAGYAAQPCDGEGVCITLAAGTSTYELVTTQLTWPDAQAACGQAHAGGHLVVFDSAGERAMLSHELSARTQAGTPELEYWVGLQNLSTSAVTAWTWVDGAPVASKPLEWGDGEPTTGTFAYGKVLLAAESMTFDRQLLHAETGVDTPRPYVCEF